MWRRLKVRDGAWVDKVLVATLTASIGILLVGLFSWQSPFGSQIELSEGEVAPHDVVAPRQITYESQALAGRARARAASSVVDQYDSPDGRIRRQQIERAHEVLDFIGTVRADEFAPLELQTDYLLAITDLGLTPEQAEQTLSLSPSEWTQITTEVPATLDRIMREEIRESNVSLFRRRIPSISAADLADEPSAVVTTLVQALMRPNSFLNQTRTDDLRAKAAEDVAVQMVTLERNEVILRAGDVATAEQVEAMTQIGLLQDDWNWWVTLRGLMFTVVVLVVSGGALYRLRPRTFGCWRPSLCWCHTTGCPICSRWPRWGCWSRC